jgi:hypothetical protein
LKVALPTIWNKGVMNYLTIHSLLLTIAFGLSFNDVKACSCRFTKKISAEELNAYSYIGFGIISELDSIHPTTFTIDIQETLLGDQTSGKLIVQTSAYSASCGLPIQKGQIWLFFLWEENGIKILSRCSRSRVLDVDDENSESINKRLPSNLKRDVRRVKRFSKKPGLRVPDYASLFRTNFQSMRYAGQTSITMATTSKEPAT